MNDKDKDFVRKKVANLNELAEECFNIGLAFTVLFDQEKIEMPSVNNKIIDREGKTIFWFETTTHLVLWQIGFTEALKVFQANDRSNEI